MTNKEIRELTVEDLITSIIEQKDKLKKSRFAHSIAPLENPLIIKKIRRRIARLETELYQRSNEELKQKILDKTLGLNNLSTFMKNNDIPVILKKGNVKQMIKNLS